MNKWLENINNTKSALVLGGGGSRGCYEIGAWRAFEKAGLHFDIACGTSIGAIVAAMYAQQTLQPLIDFAADMKPVSIAENMFTFPQTLVQLLQQRKEIRSFVRRYILPGTGMDISPLEHAFEKMFDYQKFIESPIEFACVTFNLNRLKGEVYTKKEITPENAEKVILASASCFPAFPVMKIGDSDYIDGGYADNLPVDVALDLGAKQIIAIDVEGPGIIRKIPAGTPMLLIKPILPLPSFLDFNNEAAVRGMLQGALETGKLCSLFSGFIYTFEKKNQEDIDWMSGVIEFLAMSEHFTEYLEKIPDYAAVLAGFHPSGLSEWCAYKTGASLLVEMLAWVFEIDPLKVWSYPEWLETLKEALHQYRFTAASAQSDTILALRRNSIYLLVRSLKFNDKMVWTLAAKADPADVLMARIWQMLAGQELEAGDETDGQSAESITSLRS